MSSNHINIVVPMAGRGSRFAEAGYDQPKPLIDVGGRPMIAWVIENVRPKCGHTFHFICQKEHLETYPYLESFLRKTCPGCTVLTTATVTEGAACTVLLARNLINNGQPLMIANSDQIVVSDINLHLVKLDQSDGVILTFAASDPKWSYCRLVDDFRVVEVVEKQVVSPFATVGIYVFKRGNDFVNAAESMIAKNKRVNGEFYVAPVYNEMISDNMLIRASLVGDEADSMLGLGVPDDLRYFLSTSYFAHRTVRNEYENLAELTRTYIWAFQNRRADAISNLLHEDFVLADPTGRYVGKAKAESAMAQLWNAHPALQFKETRIAVDPITQRSVIDFQLLLSDGHYVGFDFIQWREARMESLSAHLGRVN